MGSQNPLRIRFKTPLLLAFSLLSTIQLRVLAQTEITLDNTLTTTVNQSSGIFEIRGGARPNNGGNLFHSFKDFSLQTGSTAKFIYDSGIENIITRVTGGTPSQIDGTITTIIANSTATANANLFLINPSGIVFGSNAKLDIGGSFIATTADSLKFSDGSEFSAINSTSSPILTVSVPLGLQFGGKPNSTIRVNGAGNNLLLQRDFSRSSINRPNGLSFTTPQNQTLALVGGNVVLDGGNVTFPQGKIELWSVGQGLVSLTQNEGKLQLQPSQNINYGNIELINAASVDTSGNGGGNIQVRGGNITLKDGSAIINNTLGSGSSGNLNIFAYELLRIQGAVFKPRGNVALSGLFADVAKNSTGDGNNISIKTKLLQVLDGAQVSTGTFGSGDGGNLTVQAEEIQVNGFFFPLGPSGLLAPVAPGATGNGGNLNIETQKLKITNGAQIYTTTFGFGNAGDVQIKAVDVEVQGGIPQGPSNIAASVFNQIDNQLVTEGGAGTGRGGNIKIETTNLRVSDGGQIAAGTSGSGDAGDLEIKAKFVELAGVNDFGASGLFASAILPNGSNLIGGDGGSIKLNIDELIVRDQATISVSNFPSRNRTDVKVLPGQGAAGNIEIKANNILLLNQGRISADTNTGDNGDIDLQSRNIELRGLSFIATNAQNSQRGGNINISTDTLVALENSDITANANAPNTVGGKIELNVKGIFGTEFRRQLTSNSDITASGGGISNGIVEINIEDIDPTKTLVDLPENLVIFQQPIAYGCTANPNNHFVVSGRGGLPQNPVQAILNQTLWQDVRNHKVNSTSQVNLHKKFTSSQLVEAQGFNINNNGKIELIATTTYSAHAIESPSQCIK